MANHITTSHSPIFIKIKPEIFVKYAHTGGKLRQYEKSPPRNTVQERGPRSVSGQQEKQNEKVRNHRIPQDKKRSPTKHRP